MDSLKFYINRIKVVVEEPDPEETLLNHIREKLLLTGTKLSCGQGGCGACTVTVSEFDSTNNTVWHYAVNSCITPLCSLHGKVVTTVEGLGSSATKPHPIQERLAKCHGSQCGFCSPGMVMTMYSALKDQQTAPELEDIEDIIGGNLCRCTGYRPILEGFKSFAKGVDNDNELPPCPQAGYDGFPEDLKEIHCHPKPVTFCSESCTWYRPSTLGHLLEMKSRFPDAALAGGCSTLTLRQKFGGKRPAMLIEVGSVSELKRIEQQEDGIRFGAAVTITQFMNFLETTTKTLPGVKTRCFPHMVHLLRQFGGQQIRNVATIGGSLATAGSSSDVNLLLMAAGCDVTVVSAGEERRTVPLNESFFVTKGKTTLTETEIIESVFIPFTDENTYFVAYKQSERKGNDSTLMNAALKVVLEPQACTIRDFKLFCGGYGDKIRATPETTECLRGRAWDSQMLETARKSLTGELKFGPGQPEGDDRRAYLTTWIQDIFIKFYHTVWEQINKDMKKESADDTRELALDTKCQQPASSTQVYEEMAPDQAAEDAVGRPLPHHWALQQTTGEALFCDDIPPRLGELHMSLVLSSKAHARIVNVNPTKALGVPGVVRYITGKDVPGDNFHCGNGDELLFATEKVDFHGQMIGAVLAQSREVAERAASLVVVTYEELPAILTIEDAIANSSYLSYTKLLHNGDVTAGFAASDDTVEGEATLDAHKHFYLEPQTCIVVPKDGLDLEIISSCQGVKEVQMSVARALGMSANHICVRTKRLGGGFGGKLMPPQRLASAAAVGAKLLNKPVRLCLPRHVDMSLVGPSHLFTFKYKIGFTMSGKIQAVDLKVYADGGYSEDRSAAVAHQFLYFIDNAYKLSNYQVDLHVCRTNLASAIAMRGFGSVEAHFVAETWMDSVAAALGKDPVEVKEVNLYDENDISHLGEPLEQCLVRECWHEVLSNSQYMERRKAVQDFNKDHTWTKRGLGIVPIKGTSGNYRRCDASGQALVHIYTDGSVLVHHQGVEMGQGLHTKMLQVASRALGVPVDKIHSNETSSEILANSFMTGASVGSDLNGMAIMKACETLKARLLPYKQRHPDGRWEDWVMEAYKDCVHLSATGLYEAQVSSGPPLICGFEVGFKYYVYGAAVSEVEVDCLTGEHTVLRTDIVMDVGKSLNPAIDIGQIEGAFIMFYGKFTTERVRYSPDGRLLSTGPGSYKLPTVKTIPRQFNVSLLKGSSNPKAVYSSKAIGEPPASSAIAVHLAIKNAIRAARASTRKGGNFRLDAPATIDRIKYALSGTNSQ